MCKRQNAVSAHSSAESEIVSIDAGLRIDVVPALQFWECVLETLSCKASNGSLERRKLDRVIPSHSHSDVCVFESMDHVPHDIPNSSHSTQLYIFEGNAAVIQMINKGRSPNMRHVSRSHRVDLDWSSERLNLDHSLLIKFGATRDFLAGTLFTMGADSNLMQDESPYLILRNREVCQTIGPVDTELSQVHEADVHVFSDSVLCVVKQAMNMPEIKFTGRCRAPQVFYGHRKDS